MHSFSRHPPFHRLFLYGSSLYHYLSDHPRVLPAKEKQIHYFKVKLWSPRFSLPLRARFIDAAE
jgi:hypothetical protein